MKRLFCILLTLLFLAGCTPAPPTTVSDEVFYTFTDSTGAVVTLSEKPQKTAVLFSSFAQIWTLSGGTVAVTVGESIERGFADSTAVLVDTGAGKTLDTELLLLQNCDFVIASADIPAQVSTVELLRKHGAVCALFTVENVENYLSVLQICCDINHNPAAFDTYGTKVKKNIDDLFDGLPQTESQAQILFIRSGSSAASAKAKTAEQHFAAAMLEELGTYNIARSAPLLSDTLSTEEILLQDPDMIFISTMGDEQAAKEYIYSLLQTDAWQTLRAVQNGKVYFLPKDLFQYKPNNRWDEAYAFLADIVYFAADDER